VIVAPIPLRSGACARRGVDEESTRDRERTVATRSPALGTLLEAGTRAETPRSDLAALTSGHASSVWEPAGHD